MSRFAPQLSHFAPSARSPWSGVSSQDAPLALDSQAETPAPLWRLGASPHTNYRFDATPAHVPAEKPLLAPPSSALRATPIDSDRPTPNSSTAAQNDTATGQRAPPPTSSPDSGYG